MFYNLIVSFLAYLTIKVSGLFYIIGKEYVYNMITIQKIK